jgi:protein-tyrosine phosphatase
MSTMSTILRGAAMIAALYATAAFAEEPRKIAFVDTGNTGRSVTAEALANAYIKDNKLYVAVISRAVDMDPFDVEPEANVVTLLRKRGLDVSAHRAVQLTPNDVRHADVILTMTGKHKAKVIELYPDSAAKTFTLSEYATGALADVADAYGKPMDVYVEMVKQVDGYVPAILTKAVKKP